MKFTCDSCGAQYMISDDKVGANGVKVRCKKCQHVVLVRRAAEPEPAAPAAPARDGATPSGEGLDAELGHAFDSMMGGPAPGSAAAADPDATQAGGPEDAAKEPGANGAAPTNGAAGPAMLATEWYVAIGDAQVGPLPLSEVKRKWEAGDVGPDSLVWRPGMADWAALSAVAELASALSPVPQAARPKPGVEREPGMPRSTEPAPAAPAAAPEPTWKPAGASALAALASEEMAARAPEPRPAARPAGGGARSLVDQMNLPDAGGVDPTGAIPLPIKGLEPSPSPAKHRTSVARGAAEVRHRRTVARGVLLGAVAAVLLVAGAGGAVFWWTQRGVHEPRADAVAQAPAPSTAQAPAPAVAAAPAPAPAAPAPAPAVAQAAPEPVRAEPPAPAAAPPAPARAEPPPRREKHAKVARAEPPPRPTRAERRAAAASAAAATPPPAPEPAAAAPKKKDALLDFDSKGSDNALDEALGAAPSGRSVYVPPRPGTDLPASLSASQINESVLTQVDSLRRCVSEQKARDPQASGTLKMRWLIQGDGGVRDVKCLTPEYASGPFAQCITGVVRTIRFPRSATKGQEVTFPFTF